MLWAGCATACRYKILCLVLLIIYASWIYLYVVFGVINSAI